MSILAFENWLVRNGRSNRTIQRHHTNITVLLRDLTDWSFEKIENFVIELRKKGLKNATLNSYIDTVRLYSRCMNLDSRLSDLKHFKKTHAIKSTLSDDEIESFIYLECPRYSNKASWDLWSLYFECLAMTGCRMSEIADLKSEHVDFGRGVFTIEQSKTGIPRMVPIPPSVKTRLTGIASQTSPDNYIFTTTTGRKFTDESWLHAFHKRIKILGINRVNLTPYSFRHSFATRLLEEDVNIHKVAKILGHDIKMTAAYEHLTTKDITEAARRHPLVRKSSDPSEILKSICELIQTFRLNEDNRFKFEINRSENNLSLKVVVKNN